MKSKMYFLMKAVRRDIKQSVLPLTLPGNKEGSFMNFYVILNKDQIWIIT